MSEHTPEPWRIDDSGLRIYESGGELVANISTWLDREDAKIYACRIVAAVNALKGIPTEVLEGGLIGELIEAMDDIASEAPYWMEAQGFYHLMVRAKSIRAKAKGD